MVSDLSRRGVSSLWFWTLSHYWGQDWTGAPSLSAAPGLPTWAAYTDARAGVPSPCHAIHGVAVVNRATGYQIWRRGRAACSLLTDAPPIINCPGVALLHPPPPVYALEFRSLVAIWWVPPRDDWREDKQWIIHQTMDNTRITVTSFKTK